MKPLPINPTAMRVGAWCGPVIVFFFFLGLVVIAGFIPPPSPAASADEIATWYQENTTAIRIGVLVMVTCVALNAPWGASIAVWTRRGETGFPLLTYTQLICLGFVLVDAFFCGMVWGVASFRPDEVAAESTRTWNDFGWFLYLFTWPPFSVWCLAIGLGIIWDKSEAPAFPRWVAYYNFWLAFLLIPAGLMIFFKHGPFGFNGLVAFYIPTAVFFTWIVVMTWMVLRATSAEEERTLQRAARSELADIAPAVERVGASV
jgi:hypothetical protein